MPNLVNLDISTRLDITCRKGDTFNLNITVNDSSGVALDLTLYSFKMEVRETDTTEASTVIPNGGSGFVLAGTSLGALSSQVLAANMAAIAAGMYVYDLEATKTSTGVVTTWFYGLFTVNEDIAV